VHLSSESIFPGNARGHLPRAQRAPSRRPRDQIWKSINGNCDDGLQLRPQHRPRSLSLLMSDCAFAPRGGGLSRRRCSTPRKEGKVTEALVDDLILKQLAPGEEDRDEGRQIRTLSAGKVAQQTCSHVLRTSPTAGRRATGRPRGVRGRHRARHDAPRSIHAHPEAAEPGLRSSSHGVDCTADRYPD